MPNWCECKLEVSGNKEDLDRFKEHAKGNNGIIDFNKFIPYPEKYRKLDNISEQAEIETPLFNSRYVKDGYNSGGYEWCIKNWNTKWNASEVSILDEYDGYTRYRFDTPWSPPEKVIIKMGKVFSMLRFSLSYWEGGAGYQGSLEIENGRIINRNEENYHGNRGG